MKKSLTAAGIGAALFLVLTAVPVRAQRDFMEPVPISPAGLVEAYQRSFHEADALYTGKLLIVTGRIRAVKPPPQRSYDYYKDKLYAYITMDTGRNLPLAVYFWSWEAEKINALRTGSTISVMGFCQGVPPQLSIVDACVYPSGCGGPTTDFYGPYYKVPPSPPAP
jgi:hypothetical protein